MSITRFENKAKIAQITASQPSINDIVDAIYPIGVIVCGAKPSVGTWEKVEGKFLFASNSSKPAGSTGGSETVKLTVDQMPQHRHATPSRMFTGKDSNKTQGYVVDDGTNFIYYDPNRTVTGYAGGNQAHNNMPPYLSVDMWRRTA